MKKINDRTVNVGQNVNLTMWKMFSFLGSMNC